LHNLRLSNEDDIYHFISARCALSSTVHLIVEITVVEYSWVVCTRYYGAF